MTTILRPLLFALPLAGAAALLAPGPAEPAGPEAFPADLLAAQANVYTASTQERAALDQAADGRAMLVWDSRRQEGGGYGVFARAFDAAGRPLSHELRVNQTTEGMQYHPAVAYAADGAAWFAWQSYGQDGDAGAVVARRFGPELQPGDELPVNRSREGHQAEVSLAGLAGGGVLAAWTSQVAGIDGEVVTRVLTRRIDQPQAEEIALGGSGKESLASLAALPEGGAVAVWARVADDAPGIAARLLDATGRPLGPEWITGAGVDAIEPAVAADGVGRMVLAWLEPEAAGYAVRARRFDATGAAAGPVLLVAGAEQGWNSGVAVAAHEDGRFAVCWNQEGESDGVLAASYGADGRLLGRERLTADAPGSQLLTLASGARRVAWWGGRLALAWNGDGGTGDSSAAHLGLRLDAAAAAAASAAAGTTSHAAALALGPPQPAPTLAADEQLAIPPIWNPNWQPQGFLRGARAAGGDFGFEAIAGTGWTPPDPEMAVGPDRLMFMANGEISCFDKNGNRQWWDEIENSFGFWGSLGADNFVFDPEVTWDPHARRFLAMACERSNSNRSYFLLAVSKDDSPGDANDWWKYRIDVTSIAGNDIDSPNMAVGPNAILLSADFFSPTDEYLMYFIDKSSVLGGGAPVAAHELIAGARQQSMGVPVVYDNDNTLYVLQSTEFTTNNTVIFHAITNPFTAYNRVSHTLSVPSYTYPTQPPQKGSSSRPYLFEPRFWSVAQRNGSIWAVHHVNNSRARVRWYEFALNGWPATSAPSMAQNGEIDLGDGIHTYFPSIHVDQDSNAAITFARSASNEYISMGRTLRKASDPLNSFRPVQVVQTSNNAHTSGRWGDYSGVQAEPDVSGVFWGHHEFTNGSTNSWRTWCARFDLRPTAYQLAVPPVTAGQPVTLSISGGTPGKRSYIAYSLTGTELYPVPQLNATLSIGNPVQLAAVTADANGDASFTRNVGANLAGTTVWLQAIETDRTTNWVKVTIQ